MDIKIINKQLQDVQFNDVSPQLQIYQLLESIENGLLKENRFFVEDEFLEKLKHIFKELEVTLSKDTELYRSRIFDCKKATVSKVIYKDGREIKYKHRPGIGQQFVYIPIKVVHVHGV